MVDWSCLYIHTQAEVAVVSNVNVIEKKNKILEIKMSGGGGEGQGGSGQELRAADSAANKREFVVNVESSSSNRHSLHLRNSAFFIPPPPLTITTAHPEVLPIALLYSLSLSLFLYITAGQKAFMDLASILYDNNVTILLFLQFFFSNLNMTVSIRLDGIFLCLNVRLIVSPFLLD